MRTVTGGKRPHVYAVTHACGHAVEHSFARFAPSERDDRRREFARSVCTTCAREAKQQRLVVFEREHGLPPLEGETRGLIEEARQLRVQICAAAIRDVHIRTASLLRLQREGFLSRVDALRQLDALEGVLRAIRRQRRAAFWIGRAESSGPELVDWILWRIEKGLRGRAEQPVPGSSPERAVPDPTPPPEEPPAAAVLPTVGRDRGGPTPLEAKLAYQQRLRDREVARAWKALEGRDERRPEA